MKVQTTCAKYLQEKGDRKNTRRNIDIKKRGYLKRGGHLEFGGLKAGWYF